MTYKEASEYINSLKSRGIVPGLSAMRRLCEELGNPQDKVKTIHIAGTNGKGSVGAFIDSILISAGFDTGRFVSPAVEDNREIYQYNGKWIDETDYALCVEKVRDAAQIIEKDGFFPTSFEAETAAAFVYFNMKHCSYAVVECGMGGRLDATNVISSPECSVITPISLDHTAFLGETLEEITREKAGIIKRGSPVAAAYGDYADVIRRKCAELSSELVFAKKPEITACGINGIEFVYGGLNLHTRLAGLYQAENAALAAESVRLLKDKISDTAIAEGIKNARWEYRFEVCRKNPYWILDGAHNPDGAERLMETLDKYLPEGRIVYIFGVFKDKAYDKMAELTARRADRIYTVKPPSDRGLDSGVLAETVKKYARDVIAAKSVEQAAEMCAGEKCRAVVCFGSLSFLKEIKRILKI